MFAACTSRSGPVRRASVALWRTHSYVQRSQETHVQIVDSPCRAGLHPAADLQSALVVARFLPLARISHSGFLRGQISCWQRRVWLASAGFEKMGSFWGLCG